LEEVQKTIQKYSNFITYPITINGQKANIVKAIWTKGKTDLTDEDYQLFWEHIANTKVHYRYKLHYAADVPLSLKALLYVPSLHMEKYGMQIE